MDIIFNCPKCEQELAVDSSGAGTEINCPSCSEKILIPQTAAPPGFVPPSRTHDPAHPVSTMASSAAAKVEMHLKVPVHDKPAESLIEKPLVPLEVAAKESDRKMKVKTIRHTDCIEVGKDRYDEIVSEFLQKVGRDNIISISPINYTHMDLGTRALMTEFGVTIIYIG
jgi:DNA-directed RNA polymerase subunit RPC12/RpoP